MELIKSVARRSKLSDIAYVSLNIGLAVALYVLTVVFSPPYLAYLLVLLSKWRVLAVRPRFWLANIQGNTIDTLVGISAVTLIWLSQGEMAVQILLTALYAAWLLMLKPRSTRRAMIIQAEVGQFAALTALFGIAYYFDSSLVVLACFAIGYITAWHALQSYEEPQTRLLAAIWGFVVAEFGWLAYQWTSAYTLAGDLMAPQVAIIASLSGYVTMRAYEYHTHGKLSWKRMRAQILFAAAVIAMMLLKELSVFIG